ncbi:MAG TPA: hypothetical protein VKA70_08540 [Blastocatellia bacterium]|nr:hypothetical protein [Blastocatellia bacterium]
MKKGAFRFAIGMGVVTGLLTSVAISSQMDQKFAQAQRQNAQALRQYTWKSRTEIQKGGETKNAQVNQMRYGADGAIEKTLVASTPQQKLPTRGLRGLIAQKKKEDFLETLDGLTKLARSYGELAPDVMERFMAAAVVTPEMGSEQKLIRISGGGVLQPGDSMTVWVDAVTRRMRKVEVQTALEGKPVRVVSDFQDLPAGPTYMARSAVDYPSKELTLITENFDYESLIKR